MTAIDPTARGAPVFPPAISGGKVKGKAEIRALTGARGMAALLVVIYHFYPSDQMVPAALGHIIGKGYLWVDLFFVLSGFVLALNYAHLFAGAWGLRQWGDFLLRRLGRIYPLYIVLTLATLIVTVALFGRISGEGLPPGTAVLAHPLRDITANVLLVQSWGIARSVNGPGWSISTEWAAYILFPLLAALALFSRTWLAFLTMAGACLLIGAASWLNATDGAFHAGALDAYDGAKFGPVLRCLGGFTLGMLAWRAARHQFVRRLMASDAVAMAVLAALLAGFARGAHDLVVYPLFPLLVVSLDANRGVASRAFSWPPIYWLGLVSYSVYLLHLYLLAPHHALLEWLRPHIGAGMAHAVTALLTFGTLAGVAALTYRWIEVPGRQWLPQPRRAPRQKMAMAR